MKNLWIDNLCNSLAGNACYMLTITNNIDSFMSSADEAHLICKSNAGRSIVARRLNKYNELTKRFNKDKAKTPVSIQNVFKDKRLLMNDAFSPYLKDHKDKKCIVITCRVHPGEAGSSSVCEGMINYLLGPSKDAQMLRNNFVFRVFPMINPDGVIYGNYRCSLLGVDLNRRWNDPSKVLHPTIFGVKELIKMMHVEWKVEFYCDLHGHSRMKDVFMFGNSFDPAEP